MLYMREKWHIPYMRYGKYILFDTRAGNLILGPLREKAKVIDSTVDDESM